MGRTTSVTRTKCGWHAPAPAPASSFTSARAWSSGGRRGHVFSTWSGRPRSETSGRDVTLQRRCGRAKKKKKKTPCICYLRFQCHLLCCKWSEGYSGLVLAPGSTQERPQSGLRRRPLLLSSVCGECCDKWRWQFSDTSDDVIPRRLPLQIISWFPRKWDPATADTQNFIFCSIIEFPVYF